MDFSKQSLDHGIVPIFTRYYWPGWWLRDGQWVRRAQTSESLGFKMLWGLYSFVERRTKEIMTVEGRMLIGKRVHDFCGGTMVSSGSAVVYSNRKVDWAPTSWFATQCGPHTEWHNLERAKVPSLHEWFGSKTMTIGEAKAAMQRSLVAAAISCAAHSQKALIFGFDRVRDTSAHGSNTRDILAQAENLSYIFAGQQMLGMCPLWEQFPELNDSELREAGVSRGVPEDYDPEISDEGFCGYTNHLYPRAIDTIVVHEGPNFLNPNSQRWVGPIHVLFTFKEMEVPRGSSTNRLVLCEKNPYICPPASIEQVANCVEYYRIAPRSVFANG